MKKSLIILVLLATTGCGWFDKRSKLERDLGTLPDCYRVRTDEINGVTTLSYWVSMEYPADPAFDYYAKVLKSKGWTPMDWTGMGQQKQWAVSKSREPQTNAPICAFRYHAVWTNEKKDRMVILVLIYYDPSNETAPCFFPPKNKELVVTLQDLPSL